MATSYVSVPIIFLVLSLVTLIMTDDSKNTLGPHEFLRNGQTLVSSNNRFELGFFNFPSTGDSDQNLWYLGIWYREIKPLTVVWVANRAKPLRGNGIKLALVNPVGDLYLYDDTMNVIQLARLGQPVHSLMLLDSGNLVITKSGQSSVYEGYVWESFNAPSDTLLPGMKLGWDLQSRENHVLTSWKTSEDPFVGDFVFGIESPELPQLLLENKDIHQSRWGPWNGRIFSGTNAMNDNTIFRPLYRTSTNEIFFTFEMLDDSVLLRLVVNSGGLVQFLRWTNSSKAWVPMVTLNRDSCDRYAACGPYGVCYPDYPSCGCLKGFVAHSLRYWRGLDFSNGCKRKIALNCSNDGFVKFKGLKLPDNFTVKLDLEPKECHDHCLMECTCNAYATIDLYGNGDKCVTWSGKLVDLRDSTHGADEIYIRMARAEIESIHHAKTRINVAIICSLGVAALWIITVCAIKRCTCACKQYQEGTQANGESVYVQDGIDIRLFEKSVISSATNNFSLANKIGEGGFGPVFKGELPDGQKIAVKRLAEYSNQGIVEFKNEMNLVAQLQHRNLVKLIGGCIENGERMLIYEYMPNKSLDKFIFDPSRSRLLCWEKRLSILKGIAKGLDYLHYGSRLKIIHRDLKTSNILLDDEMNPRISDFGIAKNFESERERTTRRVVGTHGYMSPEYVMDGHYSTKTDVFSFGVLALEIISGQSNYGFQHPDHAYNLIGHAWKLWMDGKDLELIDPGLEEPYEENEIRRCIQIGLLCVQHVSQERPTISEVVSMFENEQVMLLEPQEPGFFSRMTRIAYSSPGFNHESFNGLTITTLVGRA